MDQVDKIVLERAQQWLEGGFDEQTKAAVKEMMENNPKELTESFYQTLEFGTGGLRGIMGVGTNRMNIYTVGMATQGLANYLKKNFVGKIKVAVAHDCRNNSDLFAKTVAEIFAANGFTAYLFDALRPTPELSFAIRHLKCQSGVVVTASHNPKEYNGYKAYWSDGAQVTAPHDKNIIKEVEAIQAAGVEAVKFDPKAAGADPGGKVVMIGEDIDKVYLKMVKGLSLSPKAVKKQKNMKIVYTPIHGTGVELVPKALKMFGFENVIHVPEQDVVSGNFPTVESPNPEEASALKMALEKAEETGADLVLGTDPDADRIGVAVRNESGAMQLLNGNQIATLLTYYLLERWKELGRLHPGMHKEFIVKTIVTSELLVRIAEDYGVDHDDVLTGFKFIASSIRDNEGKKIYIGGGEESYGFMIGDQVRDKDAVSAASVLAECAAWAKEEKGLTLLGLLKEIYVKYGFFKEAGVSVVKKGKDGQEAIAQMMKMMRKKPPIQLGGSAVVEVRDYDEQYKLVGRSDKIRQVMDHLPKSNVLQFITEDSTIVSVRPSGTEPKIKFYIGAREPLASLEAYDKVNKDLTAKIERIKKELNLI